MKQFTSPAQKRGEIGEKIAQKYLLNKGFFIIEVNYTKRIGEIDIVALQSGIIHFIEVKTIFQSYLSSVSHETASKGKQYDAWQNVSREKLFRFGRTCELYNIERRVSHETKWQIDVIAVTISLRFDEHGNETKHAKIEVLWNVVG